MLAKITLQLSISEVRLYRVQDPETYSIYVDIYVDIYIPDLQWQATLMQSIPAMAESPTDLLLRKDPEPKVKGTITPRLTIAQATTSSSQHNIRWKCRPFLPDGEAVSCARKDSEGFVPLIVQVPPCSPNGCQVLGSMEEEGLACVTASLSPRSSQTRCGRKYCDRLLYFEETKLGAPVLFVTVETASLSEVA